MLTLRDVQRASLGARQGFIKVDETFR